MFYDFGPVRVAEPIRTARRRNDGSARGDVQPVVRRLRVHDQGQNDPHDGHKARGHEHVLYDIADGESSVALLALPLQARVTVQ